MQRVERLEAELMMIIMMMMMTLLTMKMIKKMMMMKILQVEQMQRVERLEAELGREQVRLRAMLSHLTTPALGYQVSTVKRTTRLFICIFFFLLTLSSIHNIVLFYYYVCLSMDHNSKNYIKWQKLAIGAKHLPT